MPRSVCGNSGGRFLFSLSPFPSTGDGLCSFAEPFPSKATAMQPTCVATYSRLENGPAKKLGLQRAGGQSGIPVRYSKLVAKTYPKRLVSGPGCVSPRGAVRDVQKGLSGLRRGAIGHVADVSVVADCIIVLDLTPYTTITLNTWVATQSSQLQVRWRKRGRLRGLVAPYSLRLGRPLRCAQRDLEPGSHRWTIVISTAPHSCGRTSYSWAALTLRSVIVSVLPQSLALSLSVPGSATATATATATTTATATAERKAPRRRAAMPLYTGAATECYCSRVDEADVQQIPQSSPQRYLGRYTC